MECIISHNLQAIILEIDTGSYFSINCFIMFYTLQVFCFFLKNSSNRKVDKRLIVKKSLKQ